MTEKTIERRVHNFSAGPAALPLKVLEQAQRDLVCYPGAGASVMEISHRSKAFAEIHERAKDNIQQLLNLNSNYKVLFLHGGASFQFSMIPANFLRGTGKAADYIHTGSWAAKAIKEAEKEGEVRTVWNGKEEGFVRVPAQGELSLNPDAAYVHFTSNETIQGIEYFNEPDSGDVPLVCDASSDFLSRPIDMNKYGLMYAGAQKNVGPAGVAVVILREDLIDKVPDGLPSLMDYKVMAEADSLYNTPPCFAIYMIMLVTDWLREDIGGLEKMHALNQQKANLLYDVIDRSNGFYKGHAKTQSRSLMNVTWRLADTGLESKFVEEAAAQGLASLKGHRSVGGIRASIYNACELESVQLLAEFMEDFQARNGG